VSGEKRDGAIAVAWPVDMPPPWSAIPRSTILEAIEAPLVAGGERPAVIFDDGFELSCRALLDHAERFAGYLSTEVEPGDRVAVAVGNRSEFLIAFLAILANRATAVLLSPSVGSHDAAHMIGSVDCRLAIAEEEAADVMSGLGEDLPSLRRIVRVSAIEPEGLAGTYDPERRMSLTELPAEVEDTVDIGFTSGTTGMPKALAGDHSELIRYADHALRVNPMDPRDRFLCPLQFHYGDPLWLFIASIWVGTPLVVMRRFSVSRFWKVAKRFGATRILTIGSIPSLLLTADPSPDERDHRVQMATAVAIPPRQHQELIDRFGFPWIEFYGSSESGPAIAMPREFADRYVGSGAIGIPFPEIDARVIDEDGRVVEGPGHGELQLRGEVLFEEYLDDPRATAEVLDGEWLRTGDLVERDADGVYYFGGRRKELIRRGGENVAPAEVEAVLRLHPAVIDAAVVPVEDPIRGEEIKAYVEIADAGAVDPSELVDFCAERLAPFKVPRYLELRQEPFPRTPSQRIPKERLKVDGEHTVSDAWDREAVAG